MTIGKLAKAAGVGVETIRFYEKKGLIKRPPKRESGYRLYSTGDMYRIQFIQRVKQLGFTLREIKELMELQLKTMTGLQVKKKADAKLEEVQKKISDLKRMEASLQELSKTCGQGKQAIQECRLTECFGKKK